MKTLDQCRLLLVDDTKANLDLLVAGLRDEYKLSVALGGQNALQLAARVSPDLVLLDINLPDLDGYEVCRRLRAQPETAETPIIFVSALHEAPNKAKGFEAGANDYVTKPFDLLEVKARVRALLKAKAYNDAVKDQLAGELRIARDIQMGMLPQDLSTLAAGYGVKLAARLAPAGEVGGDLFAAFRPDPQRLVLAIGDVSGKGIPAALFMVRTLTLLRMLAREVLVPEQILARLNDELAADNPSSMFVTLACAIFEPAKQRLVLASGGQPFPVLLRAGATPSFVGKDLGTALGLEPGLEFSSTELALEPGDALLFYTDGVIEAFNRQCECYSSSRLLEDLARLSHLDPEQLTQGLLKQVAQFADGAPPSDDIALLTLQVDGPPPPGESRARSGFSLECASTPAGVMSAVDALREFAQADGLSESDIFAVCLALEECASNIVQHAYHLDPTQRFYAGFEHAPDSVTVRLRDQGTPLPSADLPVRTPDESGGWGLHLVRSFVDEIKYLRQSDENVWEFKKRLHRPGTLGANPDSTLPSCPRSAVVSV